MNRLIGQIGSAGQQISIGDPFNLLTAPTRKSPIGLHESAEKRSVDDLLKSQHRLLDTQSNEKLNLVQITKQSKNKNNIFIPHCMVYEIKPIDKITTKYVCIRKQNTQRGLKDSNINHSVNSAHQESRFEKSMDQKDKVIKKPKEPLFKDGS